MRIAHKVHTGNVRYPHKLHNFCGYADNEGNNFAPVGINQTHRDNAKHTNPFRGYTFHSDEDIKQAANEVVTLTEEQLYSIACARYRQRMTRERAGAQAVINAICGLAGQSMTRFEWSSYLCDCLLHGGFMGTMEIIDPWKKIKVYQAIVESMYSE